jgi:excisionase family DNA binding protein
MSKLRAKCDESARRLLLTVPDVARELGISERLVWRLIASGELKPVKVSRLTRIQWTEVERVASQGVGR